MKNELSAQENLLLKKALGKLAMHDYTSRALYAKLKREFVHGKSVSAEDAKAIVFWLCKNGFLNDADYFTRLYPRLKARGYGPRKIAADLRRRQFSQKYIDVALCDDDSARARACEMAAKRVVTQHYDFSDYREKQKLFAYLLRLGYDADDARVACDEAIAGTTDTEDA